MMKRTRILSSAAAGIAFLSFAGEAPDFAETTIIDAPTGETVAAGDLTVGDRGKVYKTGAGVLAVEANRLARPTDGRLTVLDGSVAITPGTAGDWTPPPAACQKAAFWVNPDSVVATNAAAANADGTTTAYASRWCDVRETDTESPTLLYAVPKWFGSEALPADRDGIDPVATTWQGRSAVYFGGATSGQYMRWHKNGAESALSDVQHLFVVHAVADCLGTPVGCESSSPRRDNPLIVSMGVRNAAGVYKIPAYPKASDETGLTDYNSLLCPRGDVCVPQWGARVFLDGEKVDPLVTAPRSGWQLLSADYLDRLPNADCFFRCGFTELMKGAQGGDYLGEVLVFTNRLSEVERASVERYLLAKWGLPDRDGLAPRKAGTQVTLAAGTAASVSGAAGEVTAPLAFAGAGDVSKTGDGVLAVGPTDGLDFTGDFTWTGGSMRLQGGRLPALAVAGGETYAFSSYLGTEEPSVVGDAVSGLTCAKTTDGARDVVATTGNGWLRVHTVASDVRRLKVGIGAADKGSVLQLEGRARETAAPTSGAVEAVFENPDFEQPFEITLPKHDRTEVSAGTTLNGWQARLGMAFYMLCTQAAQPNANGDDTWRQWFFAGDPAPRGGTNLLQMVRKSAVSTTVQVPAAGVYELSFDARSRYPNPAYDVANKQSDGYYTRDQQPQVEIFLGKPLSSNWGVGENAHERVATMPIGCNRFSRYRFRVAVEASGDWTLGLKTVDSGYDACVFLDNFRMVRVAEPETETVQEIPNGDFDRFVRGTSSPEDPFVRGMYCTLNKIENWNLSVRADSSAFAAVVTNGAIGAVSSGTRLRVSDSDLQLFPFAEAVRGAGALGFAAVGGIATTTFTVPAGTWHLRGAVQRLVTYFSTSLGFSASPVFRATLTRADGTTTELGTVTALTRARTSAVWPQAFTVAADEQVTLTLTQTASSAFGLVDDLRLTRADTTDAGNLIVNPGFEIGLGDWTGYTVPDLPKTLYGTASLEAYADRPQYWGYSAWEGLRRLRLQNGRGVYQDLQIPQPGRYRFKMHVRTRADSPDYANNPVRVWLAQGGVTNVLATTPSLYTRHWMEVSYLADVPAAGAWRLGIEGRCGKVDVIDEATGDYKSKVDLDVQIDDVSLVRCFDERDAAPTLPKDLRIDVAKGATLLLDYPGVAQVHKVVYDGKSYKGTVSAETCPEFVTGPGSLEVVPARGGCLIVR